MKEKPIEPELMPTQALTKHEPQTISQMDDPVRVVAGMMQTVLDKGVTEANVGAVEKLVGLFERMQAKSAEQQFNAAFVELQKEMPRIQAKQAVPNNDGTTRYVFAPYEHIMEQVQPFLVKHGFTIAFSTRFDGPRIVKICHLRHTAGHCVSNEFAVRIGSGPPKASESQADGAAGTYCKRFALADCLNIVIEADSDARAEGGRPITKEQAESLRKRVADTGSDRDLFLKFAKAATFEEISDTLYPTLDAALKRKEKTA